MRSGCSAFGDTTPRWWRSTATSTPRLPFSGCTPIDPTSYGAPDPAQLLTTEGGVSSWLTARRTYEEGESRDGETGAHHVSGTMPGEAMAALIPVRR